MARRKDPPTLQAAKGFPGRRRKAVEKEIEQAAIAAEADRVSDADPFPVPSLFARAPAYWRRAIEIWRDQAEFLAASGRRRPGYRGALTRFCAWTQYHEQAADTLRRDCPNGALTIRWEMGHGAVKILPHPSFRIMEAAEPILRAIESEFGFTPRSDNDLTRVESFNAGQAQLPLPLGNAASSTDMRRAPSIDEDPLHLMNTSDSAPPSGALN
jgi:phage terminase small subunit